MINIKKRTCKYCKKTFEVNGKVFSNHVRWCDKNVTNGDKGKTAVSDAAKKRYEKLNGIKKDFKVVCAKCGKDFLVNECENKFPLKQKYFCSKQCANSRKFSDETNRRRSKSNSIAGKKLWESPEYATKMLSVCKKFTSKGEVEIRKYFIKEFKEDGWTFGGSLSVDGERITRDLYSNSLKVCIEYDGIWHFKDIHNQLVLKQKKDLLLKKWCKLNGFRLIRVRDEKYQADKKNILTLLINKVYKNKKGYIEIY